MMKQERELKGRALGAHGDSSFLQAHWLKPGCLIAAKPSAIPCKTKFLSARTTSRVFG
jgi:hypothetical protein